MNLGQVYTKPSVARYMASLFTLAPGARVLDPCFGHGAFIDALLATGHYTIDGLELDRESFVSCLNRESPVCHLHHTDFFAFNARNRFDGIVMNPPYVRQEEIDGLSLKYGITKDVLKAKTGVELDAKANLYMYFTVQALNALKDGGELVVIFPNSWERSRTGTKFRKAISALGSLEQHITVNGNPFEGDPIVDVEILKIRKGGKSAKAIYKEITVSGDSLTESIKDSAGPTEFANAVPLAQLAKVRRGKTTGCNSIFINPGVGSGLRDILSSPKDVDGFSTATARTDKYLMITDAATPLPPDVDAYLRSRALDIARTGRPKSLFKKVEKSEHWYVTNEIGAGSIIFPYIIRKTMRFIRNDRHLLARDNFYSITSAVDTDLLMALLNNHYVWYQLEQCGKTYGNNVLKIQKYDVDNLMVISPDSICAADRENLKTLADRLATGADISLAGHITDILERYYAIEDIKTMFEDARNKRIKSHR